MANHFCLTADNEWRPCPAELCEADRMAEVANHLAETNDRLRQRGNEVARLAREVMHGREHSGTLLLAMKAWAEAAE
jgi:hypothetical protein